MKSKRPKKLIIAASALTLVVITLTASAYAQEKTPGFNQKIPEKIMTPDKVETPFAALNFVDGVPTAETTQRLYDNLDYIRGVEVFLNFIPATSMEGLRLGQAELGAKKSNQAVIFDQLLDANWLATVPKKGWFAVLRLYGPLEPWFDKTWRPGEIELVK